MGNIANVTNFTVYKEGDGISFQTLYETASQWPCPSWYHIPTKNEMQYVFNTLKTLEGGTVTAQNLQDHLFIPPVGYIDRQTGQQSTSYGVVRIWTCTFSWAQCYAFKDDTGGVGLSLDRPATGMQIRPFANQPIAPDSSWTTPLTIGTASLSVNHTLGLISITADGVKYITLSDKNLGATAYYNGTVSAANTGHYYQAGNNYGFDTPITNTSGTKVDTTGYWPGNYYSSDTYICGSSISDWRTKSNDNLWGGVGIAKGVSINAEVAMNDLTDTNITTPTNGQVLSYNSTSQKWENANASSGGTTTNFSGGLKSYNTTTDDYSAIQWPCPAGFHIPTVAEANIFYSVFTALHQTDNDFVLPVLHVTAGGQGYASGGSIAWETTEDLEYRWTVDTDSTDTTKAKVMKMTWRYGREIWAEYKTSLMNIRPFRNGYLPADGSWTLQAGDLNWAYIAENTTLGLISLSNGTAGVTIANKNVWATVVYDGSTRDATTTGTYFQRGNNYGFTYNEAPASTTSTQVDTSSYSDSTYSSSTCYVGEQYDWSAVNNPNLWWATTGVVPGTVTATNVVCAVSWLPPLPALESWDLYTYTLQADHSTGEWVISWVQTN